MVYHFVYMASLTARIGESAHKRLRQIAKATGRPMQEVLDLAISEYDRKLFWEQVDSAYANLRQNPRLWKAELKERSLWERTLSDGLKD
jgi:predicted transcriptional regulator